MMVLRICPKALNYGSAFILVATGITNFVLFTILAVRFFKPPVCAEHSLQRQVLEDKQMLNGQVVYPVDNSAYLSHVIVAMHESGAELKSLIKSFAYWKRFPPCIHNGYPTNWARAHAKMVFMFDTVPSKEFAEAVSSLYYDTPAAVRSCFAGMEIRHAAVKVSNSTTSDLLGLATAERELFTAFATNTIGLNSPSYALFMTADTVPVQANWLNLLDYEVRVPVERFWMKGSLYRGPASKSVHSLDDGRALLTMSKVAIYNIGDAAFGKFYSDVVRPFIQSLQTSTSSHEQSMLKMPCEHDFTNYLFQFGHYRWTRMMVALFRPTNAIQDCSGAPIDLSKIQHDSPDTLLVKGIAPELDKNHH